MKVLLISPTAEWDPPGGDITYTNTLLASPPEGVTYEHYADAMRRGAVVERSCRANFRNEPGLVLANKLMNLFRDTHLPYWEPFRFFAVKSGEYDLIHVHSFQTGFSAVDCPIVITDGAPKFEMYRDRRNYSELRINFSEAFDRYFERLFGVNCGAHGAPQAEKILVYTEHFRNYLLANGFASANQVEVIPLYLKAPPIDLVRRTPRRIGFVGLDFAVKGGMTLLRAFEIVRAEVPRAELYIVTDPLSVPPSCSTDESITLIGPIPRQKLLRDLMPTFDVLAMPTPHDCYSFALLEGLSLGLPIAATDTASLPEALDNGKYGLLSPSGNAEALAANILRLMEPEQNHFFRQAARYRFDSYFSWEVVTPRLFNSYNEAIAMWTTKRASKDRQPTQ